MFNAFAENKAVSESKFRNYRKTDVHRMFIAAITKVIISYLSISHVLYPQLSCRIHC